MMLFLIHYVVNNSIELRFRIRKSTIAFLLGETSFYKPFFVNPFR